MAFHAALRATFRDGVALHESKPILLRCSKVRWRSHWCVGRGGNVQAVAPGLLGRQHGVAGALHQAERVVLVASATPMLAV